MMHSIKSRITIKWQRGLKMHRLEWLESYSPSKKIEEMKEKHYRHIFPEGWEDILAISSLLYPREKLLVMYVENEKAGICIAKFNELEVKLRDFNILPEYRGMKLGEKVLDEIESNARKLGIKEISTIIYPNPEKPEHFKDMERFGMACFFLWHGFLSSMASEISCIEFAAIEAYVNSFPEYLPLLKQFRKALK